VSQVGEAENLYEQAKAYSTRACSYVLPILPIWLNRILRHEEVCDSSRQTRVSVSRVTCIAQWRKLFVATAIEKL